MLRDRAVHHVSRARRFRQGASTALKGKTRTAKVLWELNCPLHDFGYDSELVGRDEIDHKNLVGLRHVIKISHTVLNGTSLLNLDDLAPTCQLEELFDRFVRKCERPGGCVMTYNYAQISQDLTCPRRYRYRYLDGWKETDIRAAMLFGRAFVLQFVQEPDPGNRVGAGDSSPNAGCDR